MVSGNFFYRLERLGNKDVMEGVEMALNMLSEELQHSLPHNTFVSSKENFTNIVKMSFLISEHGIIQTVNEKASIILQAQKEDIVGKPFESFLEEDSKRVWQETLKGLKEKETLDTALVLDIKTKRKLSIPNSVHITTFRCPPKDELIILLTVVLQTKVQSEIEKRLKERVISFIEDGEIKSSYISSRAKKRKLILSHDDIRIIKKAHDLIVSNPERNLPTLKRFALQMGTNEFKLKYGFKELYGTSVHQFVINERFRRILVLVQYSDLSLKHIAHMMGFKSYPHFCRTFKKRYGYSASSLRKRTLAERKEEK